MNTLSLHEMIHGIHLAVKQRCLSDVHEETKICKSTLIRWRYNPPTKPTLNIFCKLASYSGYNPTVNDLQTLIR